MADWLEFENDLKKDWMNRVHSSIVRAQLLRLSRRWKKSLAEVLDAERQLNELDPELSANMLFEARHYRNVVALAEAGQDVPPELVEKARAWFRRMHEGGYAVFREWAYPPGA
jgi:hypothetical protein